MTTQDGSDPEPGSMRIEEHLEPGKLKALTGCHDDELTRALINQLLGTLYLFPDSPGVTEKDRKHLQTSAVKALKGIGPQSEAEGMLAVQMVACHSAAMECFRRAAISEQTFAGREMALKFGNRLVRTYALLLDTLDKHRGKGQQKVVVEHVHVHSGGQAIVGQVDTGGTKLKREVQPHAQVTHPPEPTLRSPFAEKRSAVPQRLNGKRSLSDARRPRGSAQGQ